jgi:tetratricopeptide (TPR) repeat protein
VKTYCKYHPLEPSRWSCGQCFTHYCRTCVPTVDEKHKAAKCVHCHKPLRYLGSSNVAQPFWTRIAAFFQYPFAKDPILLMTLCTLLPLLVQGLISGLIIVVALAAILTKYLYSILEKTSEGSLKPPSLATAFQGGGLDLLAQQIFVLVGMILAVGFALKHGGALLGVPVLAFMVLVFPASVMILAVEKSALEAINPLRLMAIMESIGWPYFVLYGHLILVFLSLSIAHEFIFNHFQPSVGLPLVGLSTTYFLMVIFNMLGYLLFQYQYQLGFAADAEENEVIAPTNERFLQAQILAEIDIYLKEGQYERAAALMAQEVRKRPQDLHMLDRLYRLLLAQKDWKKLKEGARPILNMLLNQNRAEEAAQLLKQLFAQGEYAVHDPLLSFHLAQSFLILGEHKLLLKVLKDFHKEHPDFEFLPEAYVLAAKALANGLRDKAKALTYLKFVQTKFPEHVIQHQMAGYLASLEQRGVIQ